MRLVSTILVAACVVAQAQPPAPTVKKNFSALKLLPDGSQLQRVMLPRYNEVHKLRNVMRAETMVLVNSDEFAGRTVTIEFYNAQELVSARIDLEEATYQQDKGLLVAHRPVTVKAERMNATGEGLFYSLGEGKAFLTGKIVTTFKPKPPPPPQP